MPGSRILFNLRAIAGGLLLLLAAVTAQGCAATSKDGIHDGSGRQTDLPGVDPERAYLPLNQIPPPVRDPVRPDSLPPLSERAAAMITAADALVSQQRFTEGALKLEQALRHDPEHPDVHRALATLYWNSGNLERAKSHAKHALLVNDDDALSHYLLGRCAMRDSDPDTAISEFRTSLRCGTVPGNVATTVLCHYHLAETLTKEGFLEAALEQYEAFERQATSLDPEQAGAELRALLSAGGAGTAIPRSGILESLGRFELAAEALAPKVAALPRDAKLRIRYARLLARADRIEEALSAAREIPFQADDVLPLLADVLQQSGHPERIVDELRAWSGRYPDEPAIFQSLSAALMRFGKRSEARAVLAGYLLRHPNHHDVRMQLLDILADDRAWGEVLQVGAEGITAQPNRTEEIARKVIVVGGNEEVRVQILADSAHGAGGFAVQHLRGVVAVSSGTRDVAEACFRSALSENPSFAPSRVALSRLYLSANQFDQALEVAARRNPEAAEDQQLEMVLGEIHECLDDLAAAEIHFESATHLDASDEEAMIALARVYRLSGQRLRAQRQLQTLVQRRPENDEARESLAFLYLGDGKIDEAVSEFEHLAHKAAAPIMRARTSAIIRRLDHQDPEAFRRSLLEAMEQSGPDADTWLAVADSYNDYSETQDKQQAYEQVLRLDPANLPAALGLAILEQKRLDFEASAERLRGLLQRRPNRHRWRLGTREMRGLLELLFVTRDAEGVLEIARAQESRDGVSEATRVAYRLWILEGLLLEDRKDEARGQLTEWSKEEKDRQLWAGALAEEFLREDRPDEAVSIYESVLRDDPQNRDVQNNLVSALVADKRHIRAVQYALDWLADDPGDDRAVLMLTFALALSERIDEALELIRNRLLTTPYRQYFQDLMIRHLNSAGRYADAIEFIERLLGEVMALMESINDPHLRTSPESEAAHRMILQPDDALAFDKLGARLVELRGLLAWAFIAAQRYNDAERELSAWLGTTRDPGVQLAYLTPLASCLQLQGHDERAAETLERALRMAPEDVTLNNDLAYTWIDRGLRLDAAAQMTRFAVWNSPRQGAYLDTYGWLLYKKGEFAAAKKWLERAGDSDVGDDPVVSDHLGDTCWRLGERENAIRYWTAAVAAIGLRDERAVLGADARRVRDMTGRKIDTARAGGEPDVAPVAEPAVSEEDESEKQ